MSSRSSIAKVLAEKLALINGSSPYNSLVHSANISTKLKFWDEVNDWPYICIVPGPETREYLPGGFKWGHLSITLKVYVQEEDPLEKLELLLEDVETVITLNERLEYIPGKHTTEILITSITTDEGLLAPYGVGEIVLQVRYEV
jgi:hypothetical protein